MPVPTGNRPWRLTEIHVIGQVLDVGSRREREADGDPPTHGLDPPEKAVCEIAPSEALRNQGRGLLPGGLARLRSRTTPDTRMPGPRG
jgi:hypothetical protein